MNEVCSNFRKWEPSKRQPTPPSKDACGNCGYPEKKHNSSPTKTLDDFLKFASSGWF